MRADETGLGEGREETEERVEREKEECQAQVSPRSNHEVT
jgi:hypothetical protein